MKKTVYVLRSEKDNSVFVGRTDDFEKALARHNQGKAKETRKSRPWSMICRCDFERRQAAENFEEFLKGKEGADFIDKYLHATPLNLLKKVLAILPKDVPVYVMGGLALDGHAGKLTRRHDDLDLLCWRKDVPAVKAAMRELGYGIKQACPSDRPKKPYHIDTDEEWPIMSFDVIDEVPGEDAFVLTRARGYRKTFPKKHLGPKTVRLNGVKFPAVGLRFLDALNREAGKYLRGIKKDNPKLYDMLGYKVENNRHDRRLLNRLMKK